MIINCDRAESNLYLSLMGTEELEECQEIEVLIALLVWLVILLQLPIKRKHFCLFITTLSRVQTVYH